MDLNPVAGHGLSIGNESIRAAIIEYDAMAYVKQMAEHYTTQAKNCLKSLPESVYKQSLQKIADFTLERKR